MKLRIVRMARVCAGTVLASAVAAAWATPAQGDAAQAAQVAGEDTVRFEISRFDVTGNTLLPADVVQAAVTPFTGAGRDFGDVQRALEALEAAYHARGYNVVTVQLPEQELNGGAVRLNVIETRLRQVDVTGNRYFSDANIRASLPTLQPGRTPNLKAVSANLRLVNENPAKKAKLSLADAPADAAGGSDANPGNAQVDARIDIADERPWKVMLNLDNTGTDATGATHAGVLLQHANLWGRDHLGTLQYTTTTEHPDRVAVWSAGYHVPLYALGDSVDLFASYSNVDSGSVNAGLFNLAVSGKGAVYGARYTHSLPKRGELDTRVVAGIDVKAFKNDIVYNGGNFGNDVTVRPLSLGYVGSQALGEGGAAGTVDFAFTLVRNVPGGPRGAASDFTAVRVGAKAGYTLLRFSGALAQALPADWQARLLLNGQLSGDALVPGEQFGAGGSTSVRGFGERDLATDAGLLANLELYTPNLCTRALWQCRLLGFVDGARGHRNHAQPGELRDATISSTGLGLRFAAAGNASVQLDYGHGLHTGQVRATSRNRLHVRVSLAY